MLSDIEKELAELFGGGDLKKDKYIGQKIKAGIWDRDPDFWKERNSDYKEPCPLPENLPDWAHQGSKKWEKSCLMLIGNRNHRITNKHKPHD